MILHCRMSVWMCHYLNLCILVILHKATEVPLRWGITEIIGWGYTFLMRLMHPTGGCASVCQHTQISVLHSLTCYLNNNVLFTLFCTESFTNAYYWGTIELLHYLAPSMLTDNTLRPIRTGQKWKQKRKLLWCFSFFLFAFAWAQCGRAIICFNDLAFNTNFVVLGVLCHT